MDILIIYYEIFLKEAFKIDAFEGLKVNFLYPNTYSRKPPHLIKTFKIIIII